MDGGGRAVVAPDKFKGSLSARDAAGAIERGLRAVWAEREIVLVPMADGGEGTLDAFLDSGWTRVPLTVAGPLGDAVDAQFALAASDDPQRRAAIVEMAAASGLALVDARRRDPRRASSYGTGELVRAALDRGATRIVVTLGGSATSDGGAGFLAALGARFLGRDGGPLAPGGAALAGLASIDLRALDPRLHAVRFEVAADVLSPLTGPLGASRTFAAQKGATPEAIEALEAGLARFAEVTARTLGRDVSGEPGCGAAGGLGFALHAFANAPIRRGVDVVAELKALPAALRGAGWCFTGEGSLDAQTLAGKTVSGVADAARRSGARVVAFAGRADATAIDAFRARGVDVVPIADETIGRDESMSRAAELLEAAARRTARRLG